MDIIYHNGNSYKYALFLLQGKNHILVTAIKNFTKTYDPFRSITSMGNEISEYRRLFIFNIKRNPRQKKSCNVCRIYI